MELYEKAISCKFCGKKFKLSRRWQKFCCKEHQKAYWKKINPIILELKIQKLEKRLEEIEKKED